MKAVSTEEIEKQTDWERHMLSYVIGDEGSKSCVTSADKYFPFIRTTQSGLNITQQVNGKILHFNKQLRFVESF